MYQIWSFAKKAFIHGEGLIPKNSLREGASGAVIKVLNLRPNTLLERRCPVRSAAVFVIIFCFILFTFGCATGKKQVSGFADIYISAENISNGILVSFNNYRNIPDDITVLILVFRDWGELGSEPDWYNTEPYKSEPLLSMPIVRDLFQIHCENVLEHVRQTGKIIFPFPKAGRKYDIIAFFVNAEGTAERKATEIVAEIDGINLGTDLSLDLNETKTGVTLSNVPEFTSEVQFGEPKFTYAIAMKYIGNSNIDNSMVVSEQGIGSERTNNLFWDFEPKYTEHLAGYFQEIEVTAKGNFPAFVDTSLNIIQDSISWWLEIAKTPVFMYNLK